MRTLLEEKLGKSLGSEIIETIKSLINYHLEDDQMICPHCGEIGSYDNENGQCRECWEEINEEDVTYTKKLNIVSFLKDLEE